MSTSTLPSASLYIHAKAIVADSGSASPRAFVGSQNFSDSSLDRNRELGLVLDDPTLVAEVAHVLGSDFAGGTPPPG